MRVVAGQLRGRILKAPPGDQTRPTTDRAREGLFSMLGSVEGCHVLDLYAGTGALGIEALSRGAVSAVFVENAAGALKCLNHNLVSLSLTERATVIRRPVERAHVELTAVIPFDLVFCDPPWRTIDAVWRMLSKLDWSRWLTARGRLVLEHPASIVGALTASELEVFRSRAGAILQLHCCRGVELARNAEHLTIDFRPRCADATHRL